MPGNDVYAPLHVQLTFVAGQRRSVSLSGEDPLLHQERPQQSVYEVKFLGACPGSQQSGVTSAAAVFRSLCVKNYYCANLSIQVPASAVADPVTSPEGSACSAAEESWVTVVRNFALMRSANHEDDAQAYTTITADDLRKCGRAWGAPDPAVALSAAAVWKSGLRLVVTQPSSMWAEFRLDSVDICFRCTEPASAFRVAATASQSLLAESGSSTGTSSGGDLDCVDPRFRVLGVRLRADCQRLQRLLAQCRRCHRQATAAGLLRHPLDVGDATARTGPHLSPAQCAAAARPSSGAVPPSSSRMVKKTSPLGIYMFQDIS